MIGIKRLFFNGIAIIMLCILTQCNFSGTKDKGNPEVLQKDNYVEGELALQHGMEVFNQHCASCHSFMGNEIGPSLSGVTSAVDKEWLMAFIHDPKTIITAGDTRAVALYDKYKMVMPSFAMLQEEEVEDLLGFIHKFSEAEKKNTSTRTGGLLDPIPTKIPTSDLTLVLEEWLTVPPSSDSSPMSRINKMSAIKTTEGERLFIADLRGKLYEIHDGAVQPYLDLAIEMNNFIERPGLATGFGSFAFHPEFEKNGLLYTTHTEPSKSAFADFAIPDSIQVTLQWVLTEWKSDDPAAWQFSGVKREVLRADMVTGAHGFQELTFNPLAKKGDAEFGLLYLGIGDGGAALSGYPKLCNSNEKIWGSILRIDPAGHNSNNGRYGVPKDNPYVSEPGKLGEIWCRGFRNPHRISWDQNGTGNMFISNIGQHSVEEVNLGQKGADYGWPYREGTFLYDPDANTEIVYPLPGYDSGYSYPVIQYDHDEGNAVSGGFVYSGRKIPLLKNRYIFGDIPRGTLFISEVGDIIAGQQAPIAKMGVELNGELTNMGAIAQNERVDLRFGVDSAGELYIFTKCNGKVYRVVGARTNTF